MTTETPDKYSIIDTLIQRSYTDTGIRANLRRATNQNTAYLAWGELVKLGVNINIESVRYSYELIGSSIAKSNIRVNGNTSVGKGLVRVYGRVDGPGNSRIRRLLGCETTQEFITVLRGVISILSSKNVSLDYKSILRDCLDFGFDDSREKVKIRLASDFYGAS